MRLIKIKMNFRSDSNELFYTYPQCDVALPDILKYLTAAWGTKNRRILSYIICAENHKDQGVHRHAYIKLDRAYTNEYDARTFDVLNHHPNIQTARKKKQVIGYVAKDGDYITNIPQHVIDKAIKERTERKKKKNSPRDGKRAAIWAELLDGSLLLRDLAVKYPCQGFYLNNWIKSWQLHCKLNGIECVTNPEPKKLEGNLHDHNFWLWGKAGVGKTEAVYKRHPESDVWQKPADPWWSGYNYKPVVIINDVGPDWKDVIYCLKTWTEHRPFNARVKGDNPIYIKPQFTYVTSNYTISQLLELCGIVDQHLIDSLKRRFTEIHCTEQKLMELEIESKKPQEQNPEDEDTDLLNAMCDEMLYEFHKSKAIDNMFVEDP